ncbi:MAG: hypothetical protein JXA22_08240 [Candidatus Thermoplasmatota archaeon]|nr:hypothetical protein [Candidatus Thermoplasmatota archaeon]
MGPESRLVLVLTIWTAICLVFVETLEVFFVLILLGILVMRELTDMYTLGPLKDRLNFFIYTFLFIFSFIVIRKVYLILQVA